MMGFNGVKDYVHRLEEVFARARDGALALDAPALDRLLAGATALREAVEAACVWRGEGRDLAPEKAALGALSSRDDRRRAPSRRRVRRRRRTESAPRRRAREARPAGADAAGVTPPPARAWCGWTSPSSTTC